MKREDVAALVGEIEAAWNSHDSARFAACFAADADFVNVSGVWQRGRAAIEAQQSAIHAGRFKNSTMKPELAAFKEVGPEIGVLHIRWQLDGHDVSGPSQTAQTRRGIWSWTVRRRDGKLEIVSAHNTDILTPR